MESLFAYGTLMCEEIMQEVTGHKLPHVAATLEGHNRLCVKNAQYPGLVENSKSKVYGIVYQGVTAPVWQRLDGFEGEMYLRKTVQIEASDGTVLYADTYLVKPNYTNYLEPVEWDYDEFLRSGREKFRKAFKGYSSI